MPSNLRRIEAGSKPPRVWAIGGGKGGVGKSVVSTNLAVRLAQMGERVVILDGDLGGANLDTLLGCTRPERTLADFFARNVAKLGDLAVPTGVEGLSLIAGDADTLGSANPQHAHKEKLIRHIRDLECDTVILDLGAGTTFNTLDLYLAADVGIAVTTTEPTAVQNCFAFIKAATLRDLEIRTGVKRRDVTTEAVRRLAHESDEARAAMARTTHLVVNRAQQIDAKRVSNLLHDLSGRFIGGRVRLVGSVADDRLVPNSVRRMVPICVASPSCRASLEITALAKNLLGLEAAAPPSAPSSGSASASGVTKKPTSPAGVNEEVFYRGQRLHVQTEDLGAKPAAIRTQIFAANGSVVYSRKTAYVDPFFQQLKVNEQDRVRFHHAAIRKALEQGRISLDAERHIA